MQLDTPPSLNACRYLTAASHSDYEPSEVTLCPTPPVATPPPLPKHADPAGTGDKKRRRVADELGAMDRAVLLKAMDCVYRQTLIDIFPPRGHDDMKVFLEQAAAASGLEPSRSLLPSFFTLCKCLFFA